MNMRIVISVAVFGVALLETKAQSPMPVVVPAASAVSTTKADPAAPPADAALLRQLEQMKAANEETIRKQTATLEALEQLQQAAEQLRIFARRT